MDEREFRDTLRSLNEQPCVFEKSILARRAACAQAHRHAIAERETLQCGCTVARSECATVLRLLREKAAFALGTTDTCTVLPHAKTLRLQAGGLQGLNGLTNSATASDAPIGDVRALIVQLRARYGQLTQLPLDTAIRAIAAYRIRRRTRRHDD